MATTLSAIGLTLNIVGTVLIWRFGLPAPLSREGTTYLISSDVDQSEVKKARLYDRYAQFGLSLLLTGFVLQLLGILA